MTTLAARPTFTMQQAEAFCDWLRRLPSGDPSCAFLRWADSKGFMPCDLAAIAHQVQEILAGRGR